MNIRRRSVLVALFTLILGLPLAADWPITEKVDLDAVYRIKEEGLTLQRSKVMEIESYLTDIYGPRLTGSPNIREAADWAMKSMKVNRKQHARIMRGASRVKPGTIFYMSGGKMYMSFDPNYNIMFSGGSGF